MALRAEWDGGDASAREQAWLKVRAAERRAGHAKAMEDARGRLATWINEAYLSWRGGSWGASVIIPTGTDLGELRRSVQPPVLDAIAAIVCGDALDDVERETLLGPLRSVTDPEPDR